MSERTTVIVYGAGCCWWDSIDKVARNPSGLPCCPHCRGVLFEAPEADWWNGVDRHEAKHPGYRAMMTWARGRCHLTMRAMEAAYAEHLLGPRR
jgi:hypothetical protein